MMKILAAIDGTPISDAVLDAAGQAADALDGTLDAVTVGDAPVVAAVAARHGVPLRRSTGATVPDALRAAAGEPDVVLLVVGARRGRAGRHPAGSVTQALMTSLPTALLVVPARARQPRPLRRVLLALDGTPTAANAVAPLTATALERGLDVVAVHVLDPLSAPAFVDQPHHWAEAFAREFHARHAPRVLRPIALRAGDPPTTLVDAAAQLDVDVLVLAWHQVLEPGRAAVVRHAVDRGDVPVLLLPVDGTNATEDAAMDRRTGLSRA